MAHFDPGPLPKEIKPLWLRRFADLLMLCINNINEDNFKTPIHGRVIQPGTLNIQMSELQWHEIPIPLLLPAKAETTNSTAGIALGGYFYWNPASFRGGDFYLEASLAVGSGGTATCTLTGASEIGSVSTSETSLTLVRSPKLTMPAAVQTIWVTLKTDNQSYSASLAGAKLIFVPQ